MNSFFAFFVALIVHAQLSSAQRPSYYIMTGSNNTSHHSSESALRIFCLDSLMDMNAKTTRKNTHIWSLRLYNPKHGKRLISIPHWTALNDIVQAKKLNWENEKFSFKSNSKRSTKTLDPLFTKDGKAYCWAAEIDLNKMELEPSDAYQWILIKKRYLIDNKLFKLRWFSQPFKSVKFSIFEPDEKLKVGFQLNCAAINRAAIADNEDVVKALIEIGADPSCLFYPIKRAIQLGLSEQAKWIGSLLSTHRMFLWKFYRGRNVAKGKELLITASKGKPLSTKRLIDGGAKVNPINETDGNSALIIAAANGFRQTTAALLAGGADVNIQNKHGETALMLARHPLEIVGALIEAGADLNLQDKYYGHTALFLAVLRGESNKAITLIDAGADLNIQTKKENNTALMWSTFKGNVQLVKRLIEAGADLNIQDKNGYTPLICSIRYQWNTSIPLILIEAGANVNIKDKTGVTALRLAATGGYLQLVKRLIEAGADLNAQNEDGYTALHFSILIRGNTSIPTVLIEAGADVNIKDKHGNTALHWTCYRENLEPVKRLIEAGADLNAQNVNGYTALHLSSMFQKDSNITMALIQAGADLTLKNKCGETVLVIAIKEKHVKIVKALTEAGAK